MHVLVRHGFQDLANHAPIGRFFLQRLRVSPDLREKSAPERMRMALEELGPTFVKLGQLLASRPDLLPKEFCDEFSRLHDNVTPVNFSEIKKVLRTHFSAELSDVFSDFNEVPIGAASIAQVYQATLLGGTPVVVKVQRPGIEALISDDLDVLMSLAEWAEAHLVHLRPYNPVAVVKEFARTLKLETNFVVEANNTRRFFENFSGNEKIVIPRVFPEYTGRKVLVLEALQGIPLSHKNALTQEGINPEEVLRVGLNGYLKMVFTDGLFHGDLHAGNMFVMPDNRIGLIDFGVVGRLNRRTQSAIANMMIALATEDYDQLAYEYVDLAPYTEKVDVEDFARDIRFLIAPYYGLSLKHINAGRLLLESTAVAARHGLTLPPELVMFFKSIVTIEGMGRIIVKDFDILAYTLDFARELLRTRYEPGRLIKDVNHMARDLNGLLNTLPRQIKLLTRRVSQPDFAIRTHNPQVDELRKSLESSARRVFLGILMAGTLLSSAYLHVAGVGDEVLGLPAFSLIGYSFFLILGFFALFKSK